MPEPWQGVTIYLILYNMV